MIGIFGLDLVVHGFPYLPRSFVIEEIAHIDGHVINKLTVEIGVFHQATEQASGLIVVGSPVMVAVVFFPIKPIEVFIIIVVLPVEPHGVINILGNETPATFSSTGTPKDDVVTREVDVVIIGVHSHEVDKLLTIHPFLIFSHGMVVLIVEGFEGIQVFHVTFLEVIPVFNQIHIFQSVVVGIDVIFVATFSDVLNTFIDAIDIDDDWTPGLPVKICMRSHRALGNDVAHIEIVEVVAGIAEHNTLEFREAGLLIREEFVTESLFAETLVGVDG